MNESTNASGRAAAAAEIGSSDSSLRVWRLDLTYEGTAYRGWARQPGLRTVQGTLEEALATIVREPVRLSVAGRTDAGVHALAQVASFATARPDLRPDRLRHALNAILPADIAVLAVTPAPPGFVARQARARFYEYRLWLGPAKPVRERAWVWAVRGAVDTALFVEAAALLPGRRDFAALTPSARLYHSCVREVLSAGWRAVAATPAGARAAGAAAAPADQWVFSVSAGSFLHNMVRVAVGSMVDVAQGRMSLEGFAAALAAGERRLMGQTAPARGLALVGVSY